jgi:PAS domain S-box-containing protein
MVKERNNAVGGGRLASTRPAPDYFESPGEPRSAIEEMRRRQAELEAQNQEFLKVQADLEQARDHYIELYNLTPMGHVMVGDQNIISEANATMCRLLGVEKRDLVGSRLTGWLKRESRGRFYQLRKGVLKNGARQGCELVLRRQDGTEFIAIAESAPVKDTPGLLSIAMTDISHRKKAEEDLRLHKERLMDMIRQRTVQLSELARRLVEVQERERSSIAKELHDEVGQLLTYAGLLIDKATRKPQPGPSPLYRTPSRACVTCRRCSRRRCWPRPAFWKRWSRSSKNTPGTRRLMSSSTTRSPSRDYRQTCLW